MGSQRKRIFILVLFALLSSPAAYAAVIFQDNFDSCSQNCTSATTSPPPGWAQWYGPKSATIGGGTHYAGEITAPGRGGGGKSYKTWRNGTSWEDYSGVLLYNFGGSNSDIYMRYYTKLPPALDLSPCSGSNYLKLWRLNTTGSAGEIYLNMNQNGGSLYNTGNLQIMTNTKSWVTVLSHADLAAVWDNNWHSWEWHINLASGVLELWLDGVRKYSGSGWNFGGGSFSMMQHFSMGNHATGCSWQSSWQAMDIDDFVLSTTYVGPDGGSGGGGGSDTTAPATPSGVSASALSSSQIKLTWTASTDNVGVTGYRIYRNGTYLTTATSTSYTNTGLAASTSYSYKVSAVDAAGNESGQSSTATATTQAGTISDTTAPSIPLGVTASATSSSQINLAWSAATDNVGVTGYKIYRNGAYVATATTTSYANTGLAASTSYSYKVSAVDAAGNESAQSSTATATTQAGVGGGTGTVLLQEGFDNNSFASRGWYDNTNHGTVVSGGQSGSGLQWAWAQGAAAPTNGGSMRKSFTPTESLYVSYYVKFQTGWRGSQKPYHPHMFYVLSDLDLAASAYGPLANNYLNTYLEFQSDVGSPYTIRPQIAIQDEKRVNTANGALPNNLTAVTENRSVAYCNTPVPAGVSGACYADNPYYSANTWKAGAASVSTNVWHKVEVYMKMNSISGGKGLSNGIMQQWIDGTQVINRNDVLYRTGQDATKKWAQFVLAPWIGDGSPIAQTMWLDELTLGTAPASGGGGDVQAPTTPAGLAATASSSSQINLSWTASTDNTAVTGYKIYRNGTYAATATTTSYTDTGLTSSTSYSYKVSAVDAAGNESTQSATASATTKAAPDTTAPSIPAGLSASATSATQINLAWAAATDNVGVTGYKIYRGGTYLTTVTGTTYTNTGLTASTAYTYKVSAIDAAGNESGQSVAATATTKAPADTTAPSVPAGLSASATSATQINLVWTAATDNVGVTGYKIYRNGTYLATSTATSYTNTGLTASTSYSYKVSAIDAAGNESGQSVAATATTQALPDTTAPSVPAGLSASATSSTQINLAWTASTDNVGVAAYKIYRGGTNIGTSRTTSYADSGLTASTAYSYKVSAVDAAGNESGQSVAATATTQPAVVIDTTAPSVPAGLTASATSSTQVGLSWTASTDNVKVTGYKVYRGGALVATATTTTYADSGLTPATAYSYKVSAIDAAGNESGQSSAASVTTQAAGAAALFQESFDNNSFAARGWYDNTTHGTVVAGGQSGNSLQWAWAQGATQPTNGGAMRKQFTPTESLYVSFYVKFQTGWRGSQQASHPHMINILSDLDSVWTPLATNYLNTYIEFNSDIGGSYTIRPQLSIQDQMRVNTANGTPPNNLTAVTENRSVAYCNTPAAAGATGTCFAANPYYSMNTWKASTASVATNGWHKVEVYLKMNTVSSGKGQANGIMQQWVDGVQVIDRKDVLYRTAQDATKKWAQFVLAPWIGGGSPIAQTMWLDDLTVGTAPPRVPLSAPTGFKIAGN